MKTRAPFPIPMKQDLRIRPASKDMSLLDEFFPQLSENCKISPLHTTPQLPSGETMG